MLKKIKKLVEKEFHIRDLSIALREQNHVYARTIYFVLCKRNTKHSLTETAKNVGRHHATAIHCFKIYRQWVQSPQMYTEYLEALERIDKIIQQGIEEINLEGDLLDIYRRKNLDLQNQVESLLKKVEQQEKRLNEYRSKEEIY